MNISGKFIASLSNITNGIRVVYLVWDSEGLNETGIGVIVAFPKEETLSAWREAIGQWNKNRRPTNFSQDQYRELEKAASNILPSVFSRRYS